MDEGVGDCCHLGVGESALGILAEQFQSPIVVHDGHRDRTFRVGSAPKDWIDPAIRQPECREVGVLQHEQVIKGTVRRRLTAQHVGQGDFLVIQDHPDSLTDARYLTLQILVRIDLDRHQHGIGHHADGVFKFLQHAVGHRSRESWSRLSGDRVHAHRT